MEKEELSLHSKLATKIFLNSSVKNLKIAEEIARRWRKL